MDKKEIKAQIRKLKKLKLSLPAGDKTRIKLHREIKSLKNKLNDMLLVNPDKQKIIDKILKTGRIYHIDLNKFTLNELQNHLNIITRK